VAWTAVSLAVISVLDLEDVASWERRPVNSAFFLLTSCCRTRMYDSWGAGDGKYYKFTFPFNLLSLQYVYLCRKFFSPVLL
jgi:hypothetical protein